MENKNYYLNHVKTDLHEAFDAYFGLTFGHYTLDGTQDKRILNLSEFVKDEVFRKGGKFYELFDDIGKLKDELLSIECEAKKDDEYFKENGRFTSQLSELYYDALSEVGELMFMYGVSYGRNLEIYLNDFPKGFME